MLPVLEPIYGFPAIQSCQQSTGAGHLGGWVQLPQGRHQAGHGDRLKDSIFEKYGIPLLRLPTNGSGEIEKVQAYLEGVSIVHFYLGVWIIAISQNPEINFNTAFDIKLLPTPMGIPQSNIAKQIGP